MRKEEITSFIVYIAMIVVAVILGFTVLRELVSQLDQDLVPFHNQFVFALVVVLLAILVNSILIEVGHVIGGKIGGYTVASFNVLWFCWYKTKGRVKFGFKGYDGLTGETKIRPKKENPNALPYVWGPIAVYFVELVLVAVLFAILNIKVDGELLLTNYRWMLVAAFIFAAVGGLINLYNYVPFKLDAMNDGYRLILLQKPINKKAYNIMLELEAKELDGEKGELPEPFEEITNYTASINLMIAYDRLEKGNVDEALAIIDKTLENQKEVGDETYNSLEGLKLFIKCNRDKEEDLTKYYQELDSKTKKAISSCKDIEMALSYLYLSIIVEKSKYELQHAQTMFQKDLKKLSEGRKAIVKKLYDQAIEDLSKKYPTYFKEEEE